MTRALHRCRWCGTPPAPSTDPQGRGRTPTFCTDEHRNRFRAAFGATTWTAPILITTVCNAPCGPHQLTIPGPVTAPGAWAQAEQQLQDALHPHPVTVTVAPSTVTGDTHVWADDLLTGRP